MQDKGKDKDSREGEEVGPDTPFVDAYTNRAASVNLRACD